MREREREREREIIYKCESHHRSRKLCSSLYLDRHNGKQHKSGIPGGSLGKAACCKNLEKKINILALQSLFWNSSWANLGKPSQIMKVTCVFPLSPQQLGHLHRHESTDQRRTGLRPGEATARQKSRGLCPLPSVGHLCCGCVLAD